MPLSSFMAAFAVGKATNTIKLLVMMTDKCYLLSVQCYEHVKVAPLRMEMTFDAKYQPYSFYDKADDAEKLNDG